ncbi:hypothetical protein [Actinophytocola sediminis]
MDKKQFDDAIGDLPPSTVKLDEAIANGRRAARFRKLATPTAGVAATVLLAVGAVAFVVMPDSGALPAAATANPVSPPDGARMCGRIAIVPKTDEPADAAKERLTSLARGLVEDRLPPGAVLTGDEPAAKYGPLVFNQDWLDLSEEQLIEHGCDADRYFAFNGLAEIEGDGRRSLLHMNISTVDLPVERCVRHEKVTDQPVCELTTGTGGEKIQARTDVLGSTWLENVVLVHKPDGTSITITSAKSSLGGGPDWPQPPLNLDQLVEIALDPGMTLFP